MLKSKLVLLFLLIPTFCWADNFVLAKPAIDTAKLLTKTEQAQVETALKKQGRILIHNAVVPAKNDYVDDYDRGTVGYTTKCKNYSYHKVIIPDGITIKETNFSQKDPHSKAIEGKNLTFIECNLVNIEKDPTWVLIDCNNCQIKNIKKSEEDLGDGNKKIIISHQVEDKYGNFNEVALDEKITNNSDDYNHAIMGLSK